MNRRSPLRRGTKSLKRYPLRRVSKKRASQLREYSTRREAYLGANPICEVWLRENGWRKADAIGIQYEHPNYKNTCAAEDLLQVGARRSTEIHHVNKRRGAMLNDQLYWLAVCRENHERIEQNKAWARSKGFLLDF